MLAVTSFISYLSPKLVSRDHKARYYYIHLITSLFLNLLNSRFIDISVLMIQYSNIKWIYNLKRRRELHAYNDFPVKTITLVPAYVRVFLFSF